MKNYKVYWDDVSMLVHEVAIKAATPEEAYEQFLESEKELHPVKVSVCWGLFGHKEFKGHIQ